MPQEREGHLESSEESRSEPLTIRRLVPDVLFIALALGLPFGIGTTSLMFRDGDVSWHVATGQWILRHGQIPTIDPFSFTELGHPWVAMEWLAEIIFGSAFLLDGYAGIATVVALAVIALFATLYFHLARRVSPLVLAVTLLLVALVIAPFVLARPHVLVWPLLAGWTILLLQASETGRPPSLWAVLLLVVWNNLHGSFLLALLIEAAIAFDALVSVKWSTVRPWLVFGLASVGALLFNANGIAGLRQPFALTSLTILPSVAEWHASTTNSTPEFFAAVIIGIGMLLYAGVRVPTGRLVLVLALLAMAFLHVRHQSFFIIVAACILPPLATSRPASTSASAWLLAGALPLLLFSAFSPVLPPEGDGNPRRLIAAIPAELRTRPVLNEYSFGGPLILAGVRPYVDGRADMYGDTFIANYFKIADGDMDAFNTAVRRYGIQWTMLSHSQGNLIRNVEASGQWQRVYADKIGVIDVRRPRGNGLDG